MKGIRLANWSEDVYRLAKEFNLGVEIQNFCFPSNIENPQPAEEELLSKLKGIKCLSLHGPFLELVPASLDLEIRKVTKKRFTTAYDIASRLSVKNLVLHTGFIPKTYTPDVWLEQSISFWRDFLSDKQDNDIEIHIENVYEDDFYLIRELIDAVASPKFSMCLDIGHVNISSSRSLEVWIQELNDRIKYVHLHNNEGVLDDHSGLWKGEIDMVRVLDNLNTFSPKAIWTLETQIEETEESVNWFHKKGYLAR